MRTAAYSRSDPCPRRRLLLLHVIAFGCGAVASTCTFAQAASAGLDALRAGFVTPPAAAKPRVWWHWLDGNVTREGIRLDLDWMRRVGIGGVQNFDASLLTPKVVDRPLAYMTPEWSETFRYAVDSAEAHGLEMAIASSPGWSETGGPWVVPEAAMKKLVWSETDLAGGRRYHGKLAPPPAATGPFQDTPQSVAFGLIPHPPREFYGDAAVVAYALPESGRDPAQSPAKITIGGELIDARTAELLADGRLATGITLKIGADHPDACIRFEYREPVRVASLKLGLPVGKDFFQSPTALADLEASDDGITFRKVLDIPTGSIIQHTVTFPAVTAPHLRACFAAPPPPYTDLLDATAPGFAVSPFLPGDAGKSSDSIQVTELSLFSIPRVNRPEEKAGFAFVPDYYAIATTDTGTDGVVPESGVIDVTDRMQSDGTLDWTPPRGRWRVLRFGYSLTGKENHPAVPEATGLEVDKLDQRRVKAYLDTYLANYERVLGQSRMGSSGVRALLTDSIEVGPQNWTESLPAEFQRRRGYDLKPWMPALTGVILRSAAQSDRFLFDFRRTIAELISDSHYAQIAASAHERGLTLYGEALEQGRPVLGDDMEMRRHTDIPMAAMWSYSEKQATPTPTRFADIRGAASVAHIYGQNLVAAESLTSAFAPWAFSPRDLKPMMDIEFVLGVNRPVIHTSVHQPLADKVPGLSLAIFGQYFNRNETWAEQAGPWVTYLARTAYLLQQGKFAADVLYFYGEEAPLTALYRDHVTADAPVGYGFDFANSDVLLNRISVKDGLLVTASGMRYRLLYLGGSSARMTLPVLQRLADLVRDGAIVVGERPIESPSLSDDQQAFTRLADTLWLQQSTAKGRVIVSRDVNAVLAQIGAARDFDYARPEPDSEILFQHRRLDDGEVYYLSNRKARQESVEVSFRVSGKQPEIWRADSGNTDPVSYRVENGRTFANLKFDPYESYFVVFRKPSTTPTMIAPEGSLEAIMTLNTGWTLQFQPGRGAPSESRVASVGSWTEDSDAGVRYFSGTATYERTMDVPAAWKRSPRELILDLGEVRELAEVRINGQSAGILWHPPYRIELSKWLRKGSNHLEVRVTNLWVNRLIGDAQPGAQKVTFTTSPPYRADAPLRASGLIGPVTLYRAMRN